MASFKFQVESYSVLAGRGGDGEKAQIDILGVPDEDGFVHRAVIMYQAGTKELTSVVFNLGGRDGDEYFVTAALPFADFDRHYHLLQTESPVDFYFMYETVKTETKPVSFFAFTTGPEPTGEGPEDFDSMIQRM